MAIIKAWGFDGFPTVAGYDLKTLLANRGVVTVGDRITIVTGRGGVGKALRIDSDMSHVILHSQSTPMAEGCVSLSIDSSAYALGNSLFVELATHVTDHSSNNIGLRCLTTNINTVVLYGVNLNGTNSFTDVNISLPDSVTLNDAPMFQLRWSASVLELKCNETVIYTKVFTAFTGVYRVHLGNGYIYRTQLAIYDDIVIQNTATFMPSDYRVGVKALESATINDGVVTGAADAHTALASFDGAASYVTLNANTDKVVCPVADIEDNPETIHAVLINSSTRKTDTAAVTENILVETASSNVVGGDYSNQSLDFGFRQIVLPTDPADSTAWSKAKFNTLSVGVEKKA